MSEESQPNKIKIDIMKNGPARIECDVADIITPNGERVSKQKIVLLCRCSISKNQPFCDGAHKAFKFEK